MGGASKKPISNIERRMKREVEEKEKKEKKAPATKSVKEKPNKTVTIDPGVISRVADEIKKENVITPYMLATRLSISVSAARKLLSDLSSQGEVKLVSKNRRVAIYTTK